MYGFSGSLIVAEQIADRINYSTLSIPLYLMKFKHCMSQSARIWRFPDSPKSSILVGFSIINLPLLSTLGVPQFMETPIWIIHCLRSKKMGNFPASSPRGSHLWRHLRPGAEERSWMERPRNGHLVGGFKLNDYMKNMKVNWDYQNTNLKVWDSNSELIWKNKNSCFKPPISHSCGKMMIIYWRWGKKSLGGWVFQHFRPS